MPRGRSRGGRARSGGKNRYAWHGFYQPTLIVPSDTNTDVFVLYDPIDDDHQEEVVLQRIRGWIQFQNTSTSGDNVGVGMYLARRDAAGAMTSDVDPLGNTAFDIEINQTLWLWQFDVPATATGTTREVYSQPFDIKAKRKIEDPDILVLVFDRATADRVGFQFTARCLLKEGRF